MTEQWHRSCRDASLYPTASFDAGGADERALGQGDIVEIMGVIALFGYLNRWNDSMGTILERDAIISGLEWLEGDGWEVGKHQ